MTVRNAARPNNPPTVPEAELIARAKSGDAHAFGLLYEANFPAIYRFVYFRTFDEQVAEDIASQVFLRAWEKLESYQVRGSPLVAWLYTIARNAVVAHYRSAKPTVALEEAGPLPETGTLEERVDLKLDLAALREALQQLTNEQREVLTLKFIDGLSTHEAAAQLGKDEGAVRALQMRGLQALVKHVEDTS
jgi:RNA polymerase sigma-70 factor (ECF subfamily)